MKIQRADRTELSESINEILSVTMRAKKIELLVSLFIANHNLPICLSEDLINFLKKIDIDRKVQKQLSCGSTKCSAIICNVTGKFAFNSLISVLQKQKFSLLIDESTDVSTSKNLALAVRYRQKDYSIRDRFLALLEVVI